MLIKPKQLLFDCACEEDLPQIISLWQDSFHDEEAYIRRFFDSIRLDDHVIIAKKNDILVAHAAAIPTVFRSAEKELQGIYIYAACVSPAHRGEGIFRQLMDYVDQYVLERDLDFIMLIPASPALAETYRKFGYKSTIGGIVPVGADGRYQALITQDELSCLSLIPFDGDFDGLYRLYCQYTQKGFIKPRGFFEFSLRENMPPVEIFIRQGEDVPEGFIVTSPGEGKNLFNILQIVFSDDINNDIIAGIKKNSTPHVKALCKMRSRLRCDFSDVLVDIFGEL